jgi:hypothetical protein
MVAEVLRMCRSTSPQYEAAQRDADEGRDAVENFGARLLRRPREAGERLALRVGQVEDIIAGIGGSFGDVVQIVQSQARSDLAQHIVVDEFHAQDDGSIGFDVGR